MPWVLRNINLKFTKGSRIGFIGTTGSGKSTLVDIIMGLLSQTEGSLIIDKQYITNKNRAMWRSHMAHVPQDIYLSDGTIEENIAFGVQKDKIDRQQVKKAAKQAQISGDIEGWQKGYESLVGERGVRLSGGQRQRIGIARALYKQADVLIFDEATNALDNKTEQEVIEAIENLSDKLTIIMIAHRVSTLKRCKKIVEINNGEIVNIETRV